MNNTLSDDTRAKLLDLISVIEKVPDSQWDMDYWTHETQCGTVGCAAYHYIKARPDSPLELRLDEKDDYIYPALGEDNGIVALAAHFGLDIWSAKGIFFPRRYKFYPISRQNVIERINEYLSGVRPTE